MTSHACIRCGAPSSIAHHSPAHVRERVTERFCATCSINEPARQYLVTEADRACVRALCEKERHASIGAVLYVASELRARGVYGAALCVETGIYSPALALCDVLAGGTLAGRDAMYLLGVLPSAGRLRESEIQEAREEYVSNSLAPRCSPKALEYWEWFINGASASNFMGVAA